MQPDRVVFDTNVWITYFYNGEFEQLVAIVEEFNVTLYTSKKLRHELISVLQRPKLIKKLTYSTEKYSSKCSHVVSGDPHLLSLKHIGSIQIISVADFKKTPQKIKRVKYL